MASVDIFQPKFAFSAVEKQRRKASGHEHRRRHHVMKGASVQIFTGTFWIGGLSFIVVFIGCVLLRAINMSLLRDADWIRNIRCIGTITRHGGMQEVRTLYFGPFRGRLPPMIRRESSHTGWYLVWRRRQSGQVHRTPHDTGSHVSIWRVVYTAPHTVYR